LGVGCWRKRVEGALQGYFTHQKHQPPLDHHTSLGIGLLQGPTGGGVSYEGGTPVGLLNKLLDFVGLLSVPFCCKPKKPGK